MSVFISYRRFGSVDFAGRVADYLRNKNFNVFFDIEDMRCGKFNEQIYTHIQKCEDFLLILPPNSMDRCVNEYDWVRLEIKEALRLKKNIIPMFLNGFKFPENLPADIDNVRYFQALIPSRELFSVSMEHLITFLISKNDKKDVVGVSHAAEEYKAILNELYRITIEYRNALRRGEQKKYDVALKSLASLMQNVFHIAERYSLEDRQVSESAMNIVNQYNLFVPWYNKFSNSPNRMQSDAQEFALRAEEEFKKLVNMIVDSLQN